LWLSQLSGETLVILAESATLHCKIAMEVAGNANNPIGFAARGFNHSALMSDRGTPQAMYLYKMEVCTLLLFLPLVLSGHTVLVAVRALITFHKIRETPVQLVESCPP
jgi:hypothetical protein